MNPFPHDHPIPRRTLLRGAGLGAGLPLTGSHGASTAGEMMEPTSAADTPVSKAHFWKIDAQSCNALRTGPPLAFTMC